MKYIVTGSEGFIGKNLVKKLTSDGHMVFGADIKTGTDLFDIHPAIFKQADAIFHLACVNQELAEYNVDWNLEVNAGGADYLSEKAKELDIPLIYTSTASVYGQPSVIPTSTDGYLNPKTRYAVAKLAGERFIQISGCKYRIFRLSNVYGPFQTPENPYCGVIGKFVDSAINGSPLEVIRPGTQTRDFTYVDDVVNVLTDNTVGLNRVYNLSRSYECSVIELARLIGDFLPVEITYKEPRSIDTVSRRRLASDFVCPTYLWTGLENTIQWMKDNGFESKQSLDGSGGATGGGLSARRKPPAGQTAISPVSTTP